MKKTRLLEIVREEIASALNKLNESSDSYLDKNQLNEKPDFGGQLDQGVATKYGKEDTLEAATEKITNRVLSDKGITKAEVKNMSSEELKGLLKDIRKFISQKNRTPEVTAALEKQKEIESDRPGGYTGKELQDNQTNKAILRALGFESKKGPKVDPNKPEKAPSTGQKGRPAGTAKEKVATLTPGDDGFDDVSYSDADNEEGPSAKDIAGDETAKELGNQPLKKKNKIVKAYKIYQPQKQDENQSKSRR
jgi:hypothetical protein